MSEIIFSQWLLILYLITFRMLLLNLVCSWQFMKADKENYDGLVERKENLFLFCHILTNFFCKIIMNGSGEIFCPWGCLGWGWAGYPASCAQPLTPQQILINVVKLRYTQPRSSYLCSNMRLFHQYYCKVDFRATLTHDPCIKTTADKCNKKFYFLRFQISKMI